jgi:hypothetical protein
MVHPCRTVSFLGLRAPCGRVGRTGGLQAPNSIRSWIPTWVSHRFFISLQFADEGTYIWVHVFFCSRADQLARSMARQRAAQGAQTTTSEFQAPSHVVRSRRWSWYRGSPPAGRRGCEPRRAGKAPRRSPVQKTWRQRSG